MSALAKSELERLNEVFSCAKAAHDICRGLVLCPMGDPLDRQAAMRIALRQLDEARQRLDLAIQLARKIANERRP